MIDLISENIEHNVIEIRTSGNFSLNDLHQITGALLQFQDSKEIFKTVLDLKDADNSPDADIIFKAMSALPDNTKIAIIHHWTVSISKLLTYADLISKNPNRQFKVFTSHPAAISWLTEIK